VKERILFATVAAGGAHVSSSEAMAQALEAQYPGRFDLKVSELMLEYGFETFDQRHKDAWRSALEWPWSVRIGQALSDRVPELNVFLQRRLLDKFAQKAAKELQKSPPDLIVATHGWMNTALALAQRRYGLKVPVVTFVTLTVDASAIWVEPWAERYLIGAARGKRVLAKLGVPAEKIDVVGYPVKQPFLGAPTKRVARQTLGLDDDFTCLIVLGGEGVGNIPHELVRWLSILERPPQIVVIAGRNETLKAELEALELAHLHVKGFVTDMASHMAASDLVIGKVSGATVFEALAVGRPILATRKSYRSEDEYINYLHGKGLGHFCPDRESLQARVSEYQSDPARLAEVKRRTEQLDFAGMSERIAHYLVHYLETRTPLTALTGQGVGWD